MFRSLISLMLLASMNTGTLVSDISNVADFNEVDLLSVYRVPAKNIQSIAPDIEAKAALVMDLDSGIILYEKNANKKLPMASLTKIMTAVLILESHDLN